MIDEKGKLFGKVNIIDLIVVVVVLAVLAAGVYKFGFADRLKNEAANVSNAEAEIVFKTIVRMQPEEVVSLLKPGDHLVAKGQFQDAVITDIEVSPSKWVAWTDAGDAVNTVHPIWKEAVITIKDKGSINDPVIKVGGQEARAGKEFILKTQLVELPSIPLSVEFVTE